MLRPLIGGLIGLSALAFAGSAQAVVVDVDLPIIDDFTTGAFVWNLPIAVPNTLTQETPEGAVGDRRLTVPAFDGSWQHYSVLQIFNGRASFLSNGPGGVFTLDYGVSRPLDLVLPGDAFKFEVLESDLDESRASAIFSTTLTSGAGVVETVSILISDEGEYVIPFSLFDLTDFNDVDYLSFALDTSSSPDAYLEIGKIVDPILETELPEPATLTLFGFGLLGLAGLAGGQLGRAREH